VELVSHKKGAGLVSHKKGAGLVSHPLSYYLANKRSLHIHSQGIKIITLIKKRKEIKLHTTAITIKFAQNTLMPN